MPSEFGSVSLLFDMLVREDGTVVGAGGNPYAATSQGPIIVRLLGTGAGDSPGVLSVAGSSFLRVDERPADVSVEVRRAGGHAGHASVAYQVFADDDESAATVGEDFVADAGRLEWEDGDATTREIRVAILNDELPEDAERITVLLTDVESGVGLGQAGQFIEIRANDGGDSEINFAASTETVGEADGSVTLNILRSGGPADLAVSVQFATSPSSAGAGSDFTSTSGTLTWEAFDTGVKTIAVNITNDSAHENNETFTVTLSNPTSGTTLGQLSTVSVSIVDDDAEGQVVAAVARWRWWCPRLANRPHFALLALSSQFRSVTRATSRASSSVASVRFDDAVSGGRRQVIAKSGPRYHIRHNR